MKSKIYLLISITILFLSCKSSSDNQYELMPLPDIYESQAIDPFENTPEAAISYPKQQILYVTDRAPVDKSSKGYYANERGHVIRLGAAEVMLGKEGMTWDQAKKVSLLKSRPKNYPLQITGVNEYGILGESLTLFSAPKLLVKGEEAGNRFASKVNTELKQSNSKDVFIYIHGYKVPFSNPILVTAELWHFMGYEGCFIAYSWPATPKRTAYFADLETTEYASRNLRLFLKYIAENTDAERIHIVGYSAGTRLVMTALHQIALTYKGQDQETILKETKLGKTFLLGSDVDRDKFIVYLSDDILNIMSHLYIYQSPNDKPLSFSRWLLKTDRVGQSNIQYPTPPHVQEVINELDHLSIINVEGASEYASGNGHAYFRRSPWVSSDILMTLKYNLNVKERGLIKGSQDYVWTFPPNYIQQLEERVNKHQK